MSLSVSIGRKQGTVMVLGPPHPSFHPDGARDMPYSFGGIPGGGVSGF